MGLIDYKNASYLYYIAALQKFLVFRLLYLPCGNQITLCNHKIYNKEYVLQIQWFLCLQKTLSRHFKIIN